MSKEIVDAVEELTDGISAALVCDEDGDYRNVPQAIIAITDELTALANAITPRGALPAHTPNGGTVGSLTEAVFFCGENLGRIADALHEMAEATDRAKS